MRKKKTIGVLAGIALAGIAVVILSTGFSDTEEVKISSKGVIRMNVIDNYAVDALPKNKKNNSQKIEKEQTKETNLKLDIKLAPEGESYKVTGHGKVIIKGEQSKIKIAKSFVPKATLKNGNTFIHGPLNAEMIHKSGKKESVVLGIGAIPETNQRYFTLVLGNSEFYIFGKENFMNRDFLDIEPGNGAA